MKSLIVELRQNKVDKFYIYIDTPTDPELEFRWNVHLIWTENNATAFYANWMQIFKRKVANEKNVKFDRGIA